MKEIHKFSESTKKKYNDDYLSKIEVFLLELSEFSLINQISSSKEIDIKAKEIRLKNKEIGSIAINLIIFKNQFLFIYRILQTKLIYLINSMIDSLNQDNHLVFALCSRSLLEHAGTISYIYKKTDNTINTLKNQIDYQKIQEVLNTQKNNQDKVFYGTRFFKDDHLKKAIHTEELIKDYLEKQFPNARQIYGFLCDFVHPNYGSNLFVSSGDLGDGIIDPPIEEKKEIINRVIYVSAEVIDYLKCSFFDLSILGIMVSDFLERALHPHSKVANIFRDQKPKLKGDGSNKENAIFFINAKTPFEHIDMQNRYIRENNIKIDSKKEIGAIEDGFIYDKYKTKNGELWFKVPLMKI